MRFLRLSFALLSLILWSSLRAQINLFNEDFEGSTSAFILNTADAGAQTNGDNTWVINNVYQGGNGDLLCLGFPFNYTIVNTAAQPAGVSSANGSYMHTASVEGIADGIACCSFAAADGICIQPGDHFARMASPISTLGYTNVSLDFWWLCYGENDAYGEVLYSYDGNFWAVLFQSPSQYNFQPNWSSQQISDPLFDDQASLYFGFRFVSAVNSGTPQDPGFGVDDVVVSGQLQGNSLAVDQVSSNILCQGEAFMVNYTATGSFGPGNTFTVELSDASGSFSAPVMIGAIVSNSSGSISCTMPMTTPVGPGYLVRITADSPATTGSPNAFSLTVVAMPYAGVDGSTVICSTDPLPDLFSLLGGAPQANGVWVGPIGGAGSNPAVYQYVVSGGGNCQNDTAYVSVDRSQAPDPGSNGSVTLCSSDAPLSLLIQLGGNPAATGSWVDPSGSAFGGILDPASDSSGTYIYTLLADPPCSDTSSFVVVTIEDCTGLDELPFAGPQLQIISGAGTAHQIISMTGIGPNDVDIELYDLTGARLQGHRTSIGSQMSLDLAPYPAGIFLLRGSSAGQLATIRLYKQ